MSVPVVYTGEVIERSSRSPLYNMPLADLDAFAQRAARSGLFPALKTAEQALMRVALGQARGLDPVTSLSQVYILGGVPRLHASAVAGFIKASGRYDYEVLEHDDEHCVLRWSERKSDGWKVVGTSKFDLADARTARLVRPDSGWITWTRRMLFARALTEGAGMYAPDVVIGLGTIEEYESENGGPGSSTEAVAAAATEAIASVTVAPPEPPPAPPEPPPDPTPVPSSTPPAPAAPAAAAPEPSIHDAAPVGLYEAIDAQRKAMSPEQRTAFVGWVKAQGIERPTVQAVMDRWGERARDLDALMREGDLEPVGPIAAEIAAKLEERRKQIEGAADFAGEFAPDEPVVTLDERIMQMRDAWATLAPEERSDLAALMIATGAVADAESANYVAVVALYPEVGPSRDDLMALHARLDQEARPKPSA